MGNVGIKVYEKDGFKVVETNGRIYKIGRHDKLENLPEDVVEALIKYQWERRKERHGMGRSGNSKSEDGQRAKTEFVNPTKDEGDSPESPESPENTGETGETGEPKSSPVGLTNSENAKSDEKNRISAKLLDRDVVDDDNGHKVTIDVYDTGEYKEYLRGDKVVRQRQIKFVMKCNSVVKECFDECKDATKAIAKATHYNISSKDLITKISELREEYITPEEVSLVDYVRQKYPEKLAEIERDPFAWVLQKTKEIVGYDRLKLLTFLSIVSSQMERVMGMSRVHLILVGKTGAGKSSTVKSVTRYVDWADIYITATRLTQNALGYLPIDSFDGRILFIDQIDKQMVNYLREMMSEDRICTLVTVKVVGDDGSERYESRLQCIYGQAAVITTSVADDINVERDELFNRFLKVYVNPESLDVDKVIEAIWTRKKSEISEVDRLAFMAYLKTRPKFADDNELLDRAKKFLKPLNEITTEPINRTTEVLRNLAIAVAIARGKTKVDDDDFDFVLNNFQLDVFYNGLGLTEGDIDIIKAMPDSDDLATSEISVKLKLSDEMTRRTLRNLEKKGVVYGYHDEGRKGKPLVWSLTPLGRRIKQLVTNVADVIEVRDKDGRVTGAANAKFFPGDERGGAEEGAVPGADGGVVQGDGGEADSIVGAYKFLKEHGWFLATDLVAKFGVGVLEALKKKDLVTFNVVDGAEYVGAK